MDAKQAQMRKRIWWSIYVRDRQCSASLGLPSRILDEDCDVAMLSHSDLEEENDATIAEFFGSTKPEHAIYAVQMAQLAQLLGRIITNQFRPSKGYPDKDERSKLALALEEWKAALPENMRSCDTEMGVENIWTYLLHLAYNYLHILLYRNAYIEPQNNYNSPEGSAALQAACRVTRIVEDMLSQNLIQFGQMHLITSLFSSLCIHTINLQRSAGIARKLAEHRAQICLLGLREIQKYWEVSNLVLELFFQYLDDSTAKKLRGGVAENAPNSNSHNCNHEPTASIKDLTALGFSANWSPSLPFTSFGTPDFGASEALQMSANQDSFFYAMPRNILSQGGSVDDFSFSLDQSLLVNNGMDGSNDGLDMHGLESL